MFYANGYAVVKGTKDDDGYYGLMTPANSTTGWMRTTSPGLIPHAKGGGSSSLGTSTWPFNNGYFEQM